MDRLSTPEDVLRQAVLRVTLRGVNETLGTAFGIAADTVVTAAHVVSGRAAHELELHSSDGNLHPVLRVIPHPHPEYCDLALLYTKDFLLSAILPAAAVDAAYRPTALLLRGFPVNGGIDSVEFALSPRGRKDVAFASQQEEHCIFNAFDLAGDLTGRGCSGAPLLDRDAGAVIGVVSAGYRELGRTWAIPLPVGTDWQPLCEALSWNAKYLPRYGLLLNGVGAARLCRQQVEGAISTLDLAHKFGAWNVLRQQAIDVSLSFLQSAYPVLAIIGDSNVGKTWLLADLANTSLPAPTVLLKSLSLDPTHPPSFPVWLREAIVAALTDMRAFPAAANVPQAEYIAEACVADGRSLVVLMDGINEVVDFPGFVNDWFRTALGWCREHHVRLIVSCRPEPWPTFVRAMLEPHDDLYWQPPLPSDRIRYSAPASPQERHLRLSDFTVPEADQARQRYGIAVGVDDALGRHPLMYRVARYLNLGPAAAPIGRFRLLDEFIDRHVDDAASRLGAAHRAVRAGLERIAAALPTDVGGSLPLRDAVEALGLRQEEGLDALIAAGLLKLAGQRVRFAYDQLAEPLRPVPSDPTAGICAIDGRLEPDMTALHGAVTALLRLEANDDDAEFACGIAQMLDRIDRLGSDAANEGEAGSLAFARGYLPLAEAAVRMARALPRGRSNETEQIYTLLAKRPQAYVDYSGIATLTRWLAEAPLPAGDRARMLLNIAPWHNAWPLRWMDWADLDRRRGFSLHIEHDLNDIGHLLHALLIESPATVRPVLLAGISDKTLIDQGSASDSRGEASISSLCAGILFHHRDDDLEWLVDALMRAGEGEPLRLLGELIKDNAERVAGLAITRAADPLLVLPVAYVMRVAADKLNDGMRLAAIGCLEPYLHAEPQPAHAELQKTALKVAEALRALDRDHLGAWKVLAEAAKSSLRYSSAQWVRSLAPIPAGCPDCLVEAISLADRVGGRIACDMLEKLAGSEAEQEAGATLAVRLLATGHATPGELGFLAWHKLYALQKEPSHRPWLKFAKQLFRTGGENGRSALLSSFSGVFVDEEQYPVFAALREFVIEQKLTERELAHIVKKVVAWPVDPVRWLLLFDAIRAQQPLWVDKQVLVSLTKEMGWKEEMEWLKSGKSIERETAAVLGYWSSLNDVGTTALSRAAVAAAKAGTPIDQIFSAEFAHRLDS